MRAAFIESLISHARSNVRIALVVGDLGFSVVESFAKEFPSRFLNVGVAEQNMAGIAAGLAMEGYHVFVYSIGNFATLRCLEQLRNDVCHHQLPVTVVAIGGGFSYGNLGYSHHAVQDIAVMRTMPFMTVYSPADNRETLRCVDAIVNAPRPCYLRLEKAAASSLYPNLPDDAVNVTAGPIRVRKGGEFAAIVTTGSILEIALDAADELAQSGIDVAVFSCARLAPVSEEFLAPLWRFRFIVTVEEHVRSGGLGSLIRENMPPGIMVKSLHAQQDLTQTVGTQNFLRAQHGLTAVRLLDVFRQASGKAIESQY